MEVLSAIEELLRNELKKGKDFVLADYFDFVSGTSTGAIIAACISNGMKMETIRKFYIDNGKKMFDKAWLTKQFRYKYDDNELAEQIQDVFGEKTTLGSDRLKTVLMMVLRNASTDSPWPLSNNPFAKYNRPERREKYNDCNLDLPLWKLVRASTAAPTYFPPEIITIGKKPFIFVDGGVTTYNNPAFQTFLMATTEPYNMNWTVGEKSLLLVSIGTGSSDQANENLKPSKMNLLFNAKSIPAALMTAALNEQDFLCRVFGKCIAGDVLDREILDMIGKKGPVSPKLFTYVRYNADLSCQGLKALGLPEVIPEQVQKLDSVKHIPELQRIGNALAAKTLSKEHFADFC